MNPLKMLRQFVKLLRGGAGRFNVILGCLLGVMLGMVPFRLETIMSVVILFLLLFVLNVARPLAALGVVLGKALCLALAPATYRLGHLFVHDVGLEGLFASAADVPVVGLMGLTNYCLVGGAPIAIVVGLTMGFAVFRVIQLSRLGLSAAGEKSPRLQRIAANPVSRFLMWLAFGGQKGTMAEQMAARQPLLRKSGLVILAVPVVLLAIFQIFFVDDLMGRGLQGGLERGVGAEVNIDGVRVSLAGGSLTVTGLQVTDPDKPTHNMFQADKLAVALSTPRLLAGRFVIDHLEIDALRTDVERSSPGRVFEKPDRPTPQITEDTVSNYFDKGREILDYCRKAKEYLDAREQGREQVETGPTDEELADLLRKLGYLAMNARELLTNRPDVTIRVLKVSAIRFAGSDTLYELEGRELSSKPELNDQPMTLSLRSSTGLEASLTLDFTRAGAMHAIAVRTPGVDAAAVGLTDKVPLQLSAAKVDVEAAGHFNADGVDIPVTLTVRDMQGTVRPGESPLGLDSSTASRMFESLSTLQVVLTLVGPVEAPRVRVDAGQTLANLRTALAEAGKAELARQAAQQIEKLGVKVPPIELPGGLPGLPEGLPRLPGVGPRGPDQDDPGESPPSRPGILDGLIPRR